MCTPIVNEHDEIIAHKDRADIDYSRDIFRTASVWVTNSNGDILLAQRKFDKKVDPGKWAEAVGGTVEGDDSYEATAIREAEEELGLNNVELTIGPKQFIDGSARYFVQWYVARINKPVEDFIIQPDEVEQIAWISSERLATELIETSDKYIAAMPEIVRLLSV